MLPISANFLMLSLSYCKSSNQWGEGFLLVTVTNSENLRQ